MAGKLQNQKRKKLTKSLVLVPELAGIELGKSRYFDQIEVIIRVTHSPRNLMSHVFSSLSMLAYPQSTIGHHTKYKPSPLD